MYFIIVYGLHRFNNFRVNPYIVHKLSFTLFHSCNHLSPIINILNKILISKLYRKIILNLEENVSQPHSYTIFKKPIFPNILIYFYMT